MFLSNATALVFHQGRSHAIGSSLIPLLELLCSAPHRRGLIPCCHLRQHDWQMNYEISSSAIRWRIRSPIQSLVQSNVASAVPDCTCCTSARLKSLRPGCRQTRTTNESYRRGSSDRCSPESRASSGWPVSFTTMAPLPLLQRRINTRRCVCSPCQIPRDRLLWLARNDCAARILLPLPEERRCSSDM